MTTRRSLSPLQRERLSMNDKRAKDETGRKFGALTVLRFVYVPDKPGAHFECQCDCGNLLVAQGGDLRAGNRKSCGCLIDGRPRNITKHPLYNIHAGMLDRCHNSRSKDYPRYGGRGIVVCERWHDIDAFAADMGTRPSADHSIDRINNNGPYEPGNCRWATNIEQSRNRSNNYVRGTTSVELCRGLDLKPGTFRNRIAKGWPLEEALLPGKQWRRHG